MLLSKPIGKEKKKYFLFLGRIHPIKAIDNLLIGLHNSRKFMENDDFVIKIAGAMDGFIC